jgi:hypothetical protein
MTLLLHYTNQLLSNHYILLSTRLMYQFENFIQLLLFLLFRGPSYGSSYTMLKMFFQNLFFYSTKSPFYRVYLVQNVNTILAVFDHCLYTANLTLNSPQRNQIIFVARILPHLLALSHIYAIYPLGVYYVQ